jgi:hypothetical protein
LSFCAARPGMRTAMQPGEPEEELKDLVAREDTRVPLVDPELERAEALRRPPRDAFNDPADADWLRGNWGWALLAAPVVGLVAWIVYLTLA